MTLRTFVTYGSLLLLAATRPAVAQPTAADGPKSTDLDGRARAKALYAQGESAYAQGSFGKALGLYKQAFEAWPLPGFQFNMGQCHRQMGDFAQAIAAFNLYLEQSPQAPNRKTVVALLKASKRALMRQPAETPAVVAAAEAAPASEVEPPPPTQASLAPSPPAAATGAGLTTTAEEAAATQEESDDDGSEDATERVAAPAAPPTEAAAMTARPDGRRPSRALFWTATASTGIFLATAIVTGSLALARNHDFKNPATTDSQRQDAKQTGQTLQTVTNISLVCGGLSAVGAVILWKLGGKRSETAGLSAAWVPGGMLLTKQGRF
jgi:hypothetical protein